MSNITSPNTIQRIKTIFPYLEKTKKYFKIYTKDDILIDIDSDTEDSDLTNEQLFERNRRATCLRNIMKELHNNTLPDLESFNPQDYDEEVKLQSGSIGSP
jgi:hypothetical protein